MLRIHHTTRPHPLRCSDWLIKVQSWYVVVCGWEMNSKICGVEQRAPLCQDLNLFDSATISIEIIVHYLTSANP